MYRRWSFLVLCFFSAAAHTVEIIKERTERLEITATVLADGLDHPWGLAFLPDATLLVSERSGRLLHLATDGKKIAVIKGVPEVYAEGQGGLLDVAVHPQFSENQFIYLAYSSRSWTGSSTEVLRAKLVGDSLIEQEILFSMSGKSHSTRHFGSRLLFDRDGLLYITLGDRGKRKRSQDLLDHAGAVIRLYDDGKVPTSNPFVNNEQALDEIYSYGHRNIQGAGFNPKSGKLWVHEHGPQGGDELNIAEAGKNYGWPVITYGVNYGIGTKIGKGTHNPGMEQPIHYWVPSIAPSGMSFYSSNAIPQWQGNLFIGSLKFQTLVRLELDGDTVVHEERMLKRRLGRIRDVRTGPDGLLYLLTDADSGLLVRIESAESD